MSKKTMTVSGEPEFSHFVRTEDLALGPVEVTFEANEAERAALARRFGVLGLKKLHVRARLTPEAGGIYLDGGLEAEVTQACVVTLEPVDSTIASGFGVRYMSPDAFAALGLDKDGEEVLDADAEDVEPLPADGIDVGEVAAQYLVLSLEPYPRKEGVVLDRPKGDGEDTEIRPNPFAVLKKLQKGG